MKVEVYVEKEEEEEVVRLRLIQLENSVVLQAVNAQGRRESNLIEFDRDGKSLRFHSVDHGLGFKLNAKGQIDFVGV